MEFTGIQQFITQAGVAHNPNKTTTSEQKMDCPSRGFGVFPINKETVDAACLPRS